jgi:hypothetical protein
VCSSDLGSQACEALDSVKAKFSEPRFASNALGGVVVQSRNRNKHGEIELALSPEDPANTFLWTAHNAQTSFDFKCNDSAVPTHAIKSKQTTVSQAPEVQRGANHDTVRVWMLACSRIELGDGPLPAPAV